MLWLPEWKEVNVADEAIVDKDDDGDDDADETKYSYNKFARSY